VLVVCFLEGLAEASWTDIGPSSRPCYQMYRSV
jgi:hypothetical protein